MQTRDRIRLDADVYYPDAEGEFPVLLMRQPYGRAIASTVVYAHPSWYAAQGYIVVIQDVRGRGTSEGDFRLFATEIEDGEDAVQWAAALPGSSGQVGMYGFSYQGMTQLYAAAHRPEPLKTICPSMVGYDLYADWAYEGGAFCYQGNLSWACQMAAETARRRGDAEAYQALYAAARNPDLADPVNVRSALLEQYAPDSFYHDWIAHPQPDEYWEMLSPQKYLGQVDLPMLHIGGWFDPFLRGTLHLYRDRATHSLLPQHLWIGPWGHLPWGRRVGSVDYGPEAASPIDRLQVRWFDSFLKGIDSGMMDEPPVCLFEMGSNRWRKFPDFPTPPRRFYSLTSTGLASMREAEGQLVESGIPAPPFNSADRPQPSSCDTLVHDPWRPVPYVSGHAAVPAGVGDRTAIDSRTDLLTYSSAPLQQDLHLVGEVEVDLYCDADAPSFDLCAVLSTVSPQGQVLNITQGYRRISPPAPDTPALQTLTLQATCGCIPAGHALRLSLSAACAPAYAVNPGTGVSLSEGQLIDAQVITVRVYSGTNLPSRLGLRVGTAA